MADPDRNAAIWYAEDAYEPGRMGINGRRAAGASFLKGFLRHADVDEFVALTDFAPRAQSMAEMVKEYGRDKPFRIALESSRNLAPVGTVFFSAPNFATVGWRRQAMGMDAYSICGMTHTTATEAVMTGIFDLRAGPQAEWDAIICTSQAVQRATIRNMDVADTYLQQRFGSLPPRPQLPVIPLGINCDDFAPHSEARAALRSRFDWTDDDVVVVTLSRLMPPSKFDPGPLFVALQRAQEELGDDRRLHFIACGIYEDGLYQTIFQDAARLLMPDVSFLHMDGSNAAARQQALSGADIFTFPIDNVQETFGLAPIEAMAAGLPVIVSDWDGMKDTITPDVGIRVPTRTAAPSSSAPEAGRYLMGLSSYVNYVGNLAALTQIDLRKMTESFVHLARDTETRKAMGAAALARARSLYDWAKVVPQLQDLWAELAKIRKTAAKTAMPKINPVAPVPFELFASYPSTPPAPLTENLVAVGDISQLTQILKMRRMDQIGRDFERPEVVTEVLRRLTAAGPDGSDAAAISEALKWNPVTIERCCMFLLKYGLAEIKHAS